MKKISVLIVDDSNFIRKLFTEILSEEADIEVLDTATDPYDAREKIKKLNPDVITLDIEMPKMDGIAFLEKIMMLRPMPVVMVSTLTEKGADITLKALQIGAVDYVTKPSGIQSKERFMELKEELAGKIRIAARANLTRFKNVKSAKPTVLPFTPVAGKPEPIIAIGASTGGVETLCSIFEVLPANTPPIVIVQHMPQQFTPSFAARLDKLSEVNVQEATSGAILAPGRAYLAPGGKHMRVRKLNGKLTCELDADSATVSGHRPSVDVLFESLANTCGERTVALILTGMGKDGASGMLKLKEAGAYTIGQSEETCVVYGMPKAAFALGAVIKELPLSEIPAHLLSACSSKQENSR